MRNCVKCGGEFVDVFEDLGGVKADMICPDCCEKFLVEPEVYVPRSGPGDEMSTCFKCPDNETCPYAWDDYNLDGSCLMSK